MASDVRALRSLTSADTLPANGRELVGYMGGPEAAKRALSGMAGPPKRGDYRDPERYEADRTRWRTVSRRVQRWSTETASEKRGQATPPKLTTTERRRAQALNRERKAAAVKRRGIRATLTATIIIDSAGSRRRDSRTRTIHNGHQGVLIENGQDVLDLLRDGDTEAATEALIEGFLDGVPLPPYTEIEGASWTLWPDGEPAP